MQIKPTSQPAARSLRRNTCVEEVMKAVVRSRRSAPAMPRTLSSADSPDQARSWPSSRAWWVLTAIGSLPGVPLGLPTAPCHWGGERLLLRHAKAARLFRAFCRTTGFVGHDPTHVPTMGWNGAAASMKSAWAGVTGSPILRDPDRALRSGGPGRLNSTTNEQDLQTRACELPA